MLGEIRYRLILFEICNEILKSGKRGCPPKVLHREHQETKQDIVNNGIHANHVEPVTLFFNYYEHEINS